MKWQRLAALARKELTQLVRDRLMVILIFYLYTAEVLLCVFALSFDVRNLPTALLDLDASAASRALASRFTSSGYFDIEHAVESTREVAGLINRGDALAALVIPRDFSRNLAADRPAEVQILLDGATANAAAVAQGYAQRIVQSFALSRIPAPAGLAIEYRPRVWYNPELDYSYFMTLSMIGLASMIVGVILAAAGVVREKEAGTIEQLAVTPVTSTEMILAKTLPTLVIGLAALGPALLIAAAVGVPLRGSLALFVVFTALLLVSSMGIGFFIATYAQTLQQALLIAFFVLFPVLFLSGTIVPIESMPVGLQVLAELSPLRHYIDAILGIFLKGIGLGILWHRAVAMALIAATLLGASIARLRRT